MDHLEILLQRIGTKSRPETVRLNPEPYCEPVSCFYNVPDKIKRDKGKIVYGWKIHQSPILIEAERHAVWLSPSGELLDVTPDKASGQFIQFVRDDTGWKYEGQFSDNVRINTTNNPLVDDLILLCETISRLWQTAKRESREKITIDSNVHKVIMFLQHTQVLVERFIYANQGILSPCYCGRPLAYKDCHGKNLAVDYAEIINRFGGGKK